MEIQTIPGPRPGSKQRFDRIYVCFEAQRVAWKTHCRPIIGLDGAFLKWDIKGQLIAAVGRDGDNRIVPIAWAVVEIENDTNWEWFVNHLKQDLGLLDGRDITIISDKHRSLVRAVHIELPEAEHRMCARHILGNWKRETHDIELERLFWKIPRSYTNGDYLDNLKALENYNKVAYDSLLRTNPPTWSRAFFKVGSCCNDNLNNLNESFNRTIREARRKPLLDLLEDIRRQCMVPTARRFIMANRLRTRFTKSAHAEIELSIDKSRDCKRYMSTNDVHEVDYHGCGYRVDMNKKTCGCGKWELVGIPCIHAAFVIITKKQKVDDYVSEYFTTLKWRQTYAKNIEPVED
ncbi:uncharacterized protein LOC112086444 [Eutrema salsugineum]|uniref:uncharacterized protein LOC112086444 n=1 Tax=Eutrema salsugineum TaxID=72664 RepID=UPI000CED4AA6|nr:uncharacterized protein LOC112086444 [Eutrema salsugineum]